MGFSLHAAAQNSILSLMIHSEHYYPHIFVWKPLAGAPSLLNPQFWVHTSLKVINCTFHFCLGFWIVIECKYCSWSVLREHQLWNIPWNADVCHVIVHNLHINTHLFNCRQCGWSDLQVCGSRPSLQSYVFDNCYLLVVWWLGKYSQSSGSLAHFKPAQRELKVLEAMEYNTK